MLRKLLLVLGFIFTFFVAMGLLGVATIIYFSYDLPKISKLSDYKPPIPSRILSRDGVVLAELGKENREVVAISQIPQRVIDAFLSAEDANFYQHTGVDYWGVLRATIANLKAGRVVQGGSTITQQVAKSLLLSNKRSFTRKIKDFLLAQRIEKRFSKKEILYLYLNQVYLGGGFYGVKSAIKGYFNKELSEATIAECAMIAGLLVAPGRYSPYVRPVYAKRRQAYVLKRMFENGKISEKEYHEALEEKIKYFVRHKEHFKAGYFTDWVRQRVIEKVGEENFLTGGFEVQTTLDYELQQVAEKALTKGLKEIDKRQGFKGPIGHLEFADETEKILHIKEVRKKILKEKSLYFVLDEDNKRKYELELDEDKFLLSLEDSRSFYKEINNKHFVAGNSPLDTFKQYIEPDKMYKALVTKVDNWARLIYVEVAGVKGVIPYKYFRWAHERVISADRQYFSYVTKPSTIVQEGDLIWINYLGKEVSAWSVAHGDFRDKFADYRKLDLVKKQRFLLMSLEQQEDVQGAAVSLDQKTGEILTFVGGDDFLRSQFNRIIQSSRQPGSSFKPILYAAALENGYTPASIILDTPESLGGVDETLNWKPRNYDGKFKGPITLREALEHSRNVPAIKVAQDIGVETIAKFVKRIGDNVKLPEDLSISLGSFGISLLDLTSTYAIFPNGGKLIDAISIKSIIDRDGNKYEIDEHKKLNWIKQYQEELAQAELSKVEQQEVTEGEQSLEDSVSPPNPYLLNLNEEQVYDKRLAYIMTKLLQGVVLHGTGRSAKKISPFLGGKTGTTNKYIDALFIGFSSKVVAGVWTGFDNNQTLGWGETGAKAALPIWKELMAAHLDKLGESDFVAPEGVINVQIDKTTGRPVESIDSNTIMEVFVKGTEPGAKDPLFKKDQKDVDNMDQSIYEDDDYFENQ